MNMLTSACAVFRFHHVADAWWYRDSLRNSLEKLVALGAVIVRDARAPSVKRDVLPRPGNGNGTARARRASR